MAKRHDRLSRRVEPAGRPELRLTLSEPPSSTMAGTPTPMGPTGPTGTRSAFLAHGRLRLDQDFGHGEDHVPVVSSQQVRDPSLDQIDEAAASGHTSPDV